MNTTIEVDTLVNTLTNIYLNSKFDTINVIDLMNFIKIAMEYSEKVTTNGEMKRNIVMQGVITMIDRFVRDEKSKSLMKSLVPQIINTIIDASKKRWFINMKRKYKSCCF